MPWAGAVVVVPVGLLAGVPVVEAAPGIPARVTDIPVRSGRRLRTVHGTLAELAPRAASFGEDYLRVWLREPVRAGLRDDTVAILPNALEVRIDPEFAAPTRTDRPEAARGPRSPGQLFEEYCVTRNVTDPRVAALFAQLHDEVTAVGGAD